MKLVYVATGLGATSRGVGILKALERGTLATGWTALPRMEGIDCTPGLPLVADAYIWDGMTRRPERPGLHISIGELGLDVDEEIDVQVPVLPRVPAEFDPQRAEDWWSHPPDRLVVLGGRIYEEPVKPPPVRILACRGGGWGRVKKFKKQVKKSHPLARFALPGREFYWPAIELMASAQIVVGGGQSQREFEALQTEEYGGAAWVAGEIQAFLESQGVWA